MAEAMHGGDEVRESSTKREIRGCRAVWPGCRAGLGCELTRDWTGSKAASTATGEDVGLRSKRRENIQDLELTGFPGPAEPTGDNGDPGKRDLP